MRYIKRFIMFLLALILTVSCSNEKKNEHAEVLANKISEQLLDWKLSNNTVVEIDDNTLNVKIIYQKSDDSTYYFDHESNNMVLTMLGYSLYHELKLYEDINFQLKFEGHPDILTIEVDQSRLKNNFDIFNSSPFFYGFVEYSFIHFEYLGVLRLTQLTKHLNKIIPELFDFEGSFWDLLFLYSIECMRTEKNQINVYHFILVVGEARESVEFQGHTFDQDVFNYFLKTCGYDESILEKKLIELMKFLGISL